MKFKMGCGPYKQSCRRQAGTHIDSHVCTAPKINLTSIKTIRMIPFVCFCVIDTTLLSVAARRNVHVWNGFKS